jgi:hypothetical protein
MGAMIVNWSDWKPYPSAVRAGAFDAPTGPGLYEVCHVATGEQVAFGSAADVAAALAAVMEPQGWSWSWFRRSVRPRHNPFELEYRTVAADSVASARVAASQLLAHREAMWRRYAATRV